jgi:hypothetical protein
MKPFTKNISDSNTSKPKKAKGLTNFLFLVILLLTIPTFLYVFNVRTVNEIIKYTLNIAVPLSAILIVIITYLGFREEFNRKYVRALLLVPFFVVFWAMSYYALAVSIKDMYSWVVSPKFSKNTTIVLVVIITMIFGLLFFYFRLKLRSIYGITELIFGLIIAANKITEVNSEVLDSSFYLPFLTASIYLVVRGLDNIHQGLNKEPIDPLAKKINEFLRRT